MSDIPDWLVELAAQGGQDEEEETVNGSELPQDDFSESFDFVSENELVVAPEDAAPLTEEEQAEEPEADLMAALRSQVEADVAQADAVAEKPGRSFGLRLPGLLPWQQLVLAILLLLDVVVIGLLFLVMLGRVSIP